MESGKSRRTANESFKLERVTLSFKTEEIGLLTSYVIRAFENSKYRTGLYGPRFAAS